MLNDLVAQFRKLNISVKFDNRTTQKPGFKFAEWELKGVPVRIAVGPKDLENGTFEIARRDTLSKEVKPADGIVVLYSRFIRANSERFIPKSIRLQNTHITKVDSFDEFKDVLETKAGFLAAHWDGTAETEEKIKDLTKATIRCIPLDSVEEEGMYLYR